MQVILAKAVYASLKFGCYKRHRACKRVWEGILTWELIQRHWFEPLYKLNLIKANNISLC